LIKFKFEAVLFVCDTKEILVEKITHVEFISSKLNIFLLVYLCLLIDEVCLLIMIPVNP